MSRGWHIRSVASHSAVFEQVLVGDDEDGALVAEQLLRVQAGFSQEALGVRVELRAEEVEWPGTDDEWKTNVTERYTDNLMNALSSLRAKWDAQRTGASTPLDAADAPEGMGRLTPGLRQGAPTEVGTWAYAAERYAMSRGCILTDQATRLEASGSGWEALRVFCDQSPPMVVQCQDGDCTSAD